MSLLEIDRLVAAYGGVEVLKGISLRVERGEIVALLGSNGAGKTTLLRTVSGLVRPRSGSVMFAGRNIVGSAAHDIVTLGLSHVPEGRRIFDVLSVEENLRIGGYPMRKNPELLKRRIGTVYETFPRLLERRQQLAGTLSGGEQQMLAIGRALMSNPTLIALDEPSLGLSPLLSKVILRIVQDFARSGTAVLLVEQNAKQALAIANRAYVIETGRLILEDAATNLINDERIRQAYLGGYGTIDKE
jgi:branched-chain amino acid transport system ATP-binding protein